MLKWEMQYVKKAAIYKLKHLDEKELNFVINMIDLLKN